MYLIKRFFTKKILRPIAEIVGIPKWTRKPGLKGLDDKLAKYLNFRNGIFVEAGGNNGYSQSNTFYLEKGLHWKGVLVEAIPELYEKCKKRRPRAKTFNAGLVSNEYKKKTLKMHYANLMSIAEGAMNSKSQKDHIAQGISYNDETSYTIEVVAKTFTQILDDSGYKKIDFLSIDLEGYELEALKGWDFNRYRPRYILIEVRNLAVIDAFFTTKNYKRECLLSHHDYLYIDCQETA